MDKNQGKPCETCAHALKTGKMYPCAVCRSSDKWEAKKVVGGEDLEEPLYLSGGSSAEEAEGFYFRPSRPGESLLVAGDLLAPGFSLKNAVKVINSAPEEPPKRPASLLALADEIADSLLSWRDGSGGSKDLRKAQRILTALIMLEEEDVED